MLKVCDWLRTQPVSIVVLYLALLCCLYRQMTKKTNLTPKTPHTTTLLWLPMTPDAYCFYFRRNSTAHAEKFILITDLLLTMILRYPLYMKQTKTISLSFSSWRLDTTSNAYNFHLTLYYQPHLVHFYFHFSIIDIITRRHNLQDKWQLLLNMTIRPKLWRTCYFQSGRWQKERGADLTLEGEDPGPASHLRERARSWHQGDGGGG